MAKIQIFDGPIGNYGRMIQAAATAILVLFAMVGCAGGGAGLAEAGEDSSLDEGRRIFNQHCSSCHATSQDQIVVGPSMGGIADRAGDRVAGMGAEAYLRASIEGPGDYLVEGFADLMPPYLANSLSDREMDALIEFLLSLE